MPSLKQIRKIKQRGAFFFGIGGILALIAAAKLAPPVHQAKVRSIGGEHAKQIATQIAKDFLLHAGAVDPQTWILHPQAAERIAAIRPPLAWGHALPPNQARAVLRAYQDQFVIHLRSNRKPAQPPAPSPIQPRTQQPLPALPTAPRTQQPLSAAVQKKQAALQKKQAAKHHKQQIEQRQNALLSALRDRIAPDIYMRLGFGAAQEIATFQGKRPQTPASWGWSEMWVLFVIGSAVSLAGLGVWRQMLTVESRLLEQGEHTGQDARSPFVLLALTLPPMRTLEQEIATLDGPALCKRIDTLLLSFITPFTEVRQKVIDRFGMQDGAEILVTVAFAERMLNRVWSAAADGHLAEARQVFPDALQALEEAQQKLERLSS